MRSNPTLLSIVVPCYNEEKNIAVFFSALHRALSLAPFPIELIAVNDGSQDQTLQALLEIKKKCAEQIYPWVLRILDFSRNFGKEAAMAAGLSQARGEVVLLMDVDLQHPPSCIVTMVEWWRKGYDKIVAVGALEKRQATTGWRNLSSQFFYKVFNGLSDRPLPQQVKDFSLMDRKVVDALLQLQERNRFTKGLMNWVGFKTYYLEINQVEMNRFAGRSSWNWRRLWSYAIDGITAFSHLPLRIWGVIGFGISLLALIYMVWILMKTLVLGRDVQGYASIMVTILFLGGIQLISIGVIAEYLSRIFIEVKKRPLYFIENAYDSEHDKPDL